VGGVESEFSDQLWLWPSRTIFLLKMRILLGPIIYFTMKLQERAAQQEGNEEHGWTIYRN
jgi:hypothetical protein